jgi:uncharacterized protein YbcI
MPVYAETHPGAEGGSALAISNAVVKLFREHTGRGPTKARTDINPSSVLVLMGDALTKGERSLADGGRAALVLEIRRAFQAEMREELVAVVEGVTERKVVAFMSEAHIDPDMSAEVFVLEPSPAAHRRA